MTENKRIAVDLAKSKSFKRPFDFFRGFEIAMVVIFVAVLISAGIFGAPGSRELTIKNWAQVSPTDFALTATRELAGIDGDDSNGPPYNLLSKGESLGPISLQRLTGIDIPVDPAQSFVILPLTASVQEGVYSAIGVIGGLGTKEQSKAFEGFLIGQKAKLSEAITLWNSARATEQGQWTSSYISALESVGDRQKILPDPKFGPVKTLTDELLFLAQAGTLDGILAANNAPYSSDFTVPMLFIGDSQYIHDQVRAARLDGKRTAISSGSGSYPGQFWLIPYSSWFSMEPFASSKNADIEVSAIVLFICLFTIFIPKMPFINTLMRKFPFRNVPPRRKNYR